MRQSDLLRWILPVLLALTSSCSMLKRERGVAISSDPPGAAIVLDGRDSGFVTPTVLNIDDDHVNLELVRPGYETARRRLVDVSRMDTVFWDEMSIHYNTWNFPLWLNVEDFFLPVKFKGGLQPARVFVRLRRLSER